MQLCLAVNALNTCNKTWDDFRVSLKITHNKLHVCKATLTKYFTGDGGPVKKKLESLICSTKLSQNQGLWNKNLNESANTYM